MIHKAWTFTAGNADDLLHTAEMLEKLDASLVDTYAKKRCAPEAIAGWMKAETWFSAGESVERGFADRVAEAVPKAQADWNLSVYANAPVVPAAAASINPQNRERYERTARLLAVTRHWRFLHEQHSGIAREARPRPASTGTFWTAIPGPSRKRLANSSIRWKARFPPLMMPLPAMKRRWPWKPTV
ncbi:MAG: ATP-dependent Clp protease proteolytic subunit [Bilophila wadsworthia]